MEVALPNGIKKISEGMEQSKESKGRKNEANIVHTMYLCVRNILLKCFSSLFLCCVIFLTTVSLRKDFKIMYVVMF